jgi:biotin transport system permease protein
MLAGLPIGVYVPGTSVVHRAPIGVKLGCLLVGVSVLVLMRSPIAVLMGTLVVVLGYGLARIPVRLVVAQAWPLRWFVLALLPLQAWLAGWVTAVVVVGTMVLAVLMAALVTLTTTTTDLLAWTDRLLARVPQGAALSLILILTLRAIAVLARLLDESRQARLARGATWSSRALVTPVVIRSIGYAHGLGEALMARGLDDDPQD